MMIFILIEIDHMIDL